MVCNALRRTDAFGGPDRSEQGDLALALELKDIDTSKPVDLYFGPTPPKDGEGRWIKTQPGRGWFSYIRIYGPTQPAFDGSWKPNDIEEIK
ncbi:DUF1214 domain-containing protein [Rhizobium sp. YTU87027]|uniref:DUF1214 domain-containing protein n=1 Tax=Rhizobium sp. YTU87027 TaxID=3417741 RepID=UPI003D696952